jgi:hypothetical protein
LSALPIPLAITFLDRAFELTKRNIPVIPLLPEEKIAFLTGWENLSTTDTQQIEKWAGENSDYNCAAVAYPTLNGNWFLEVDSPEVIQRIETETGQTIPRTFRVRSSPGRGHFYFKQTAASIAMGNLAQHAVKNNNFSCRVDRQYVVGPFSVHAKTGGLYEIVSDAPIIEAPDWLIQWCVSQKTTKEKKPVEINTTVSIPEGGRNSWLCSVGGKLRHDGLEYEEILTVLLRRNQQCQPPLLEDEVKTIARSVSNYAAGKDEIILIGGKLAGAEQVEEKPVIDTTAQPDRPVFPKWAIEGTTIYNGLVRPVVENSSKHAEFIFMPAVQMMLNYLSDRVRIKMSNVRLNMYVGLISPYGKFFKSSSCELAHDYFKSIGVSDFHTVRNAEGKVIVTQAGSSEGFGLSMSKINARHAILYYDEFSKLMSKAGIEHSSFGSDLLSMYNSAEFANQIKSQKDSFSFPAGSYCFGWLFCTTDRGFNRQWPKIAGIASGLEDRLFFVISPKEPRPLVMEQTFDWTNAAIETRRMIDQAIQQGVFEYDSIEQVQRIASRMDARSLELVQKLALYFAVDLNRTSIDEECVERAEALVKYRIETAEFLAPIEADNEQGRLQKEIIRELQRNSGKTAHRDLCRNLDYLRYGMDKWRAAYFGLVKEGLIAEFTEPSAKGGRKIKVVGLMRRDDE